MKKLLPVAIVLLASFGSVGRAQYVGSADVLRPVYRCSMSGGYRMSSSVPAEYTYFPREASVAWLYRDAGPDHVYLWRKFNGTDHMDTMISTEGAPAYTMEGDLGFMSTTLKPGMNQMWRAVSLTLGHATFSVNESLPPGFSREGFTAYAYQRLPDDMADVSPWPTPTLTSISSGNLSMQLNRKAGGAVWSCVYNGVEFLNRADYGRLLQSAMFTHPGSYRMSNYTAQPVVCNPTEAGFAWYNPNRSYGSPLVSFSAAGNTASTTCVPSNSCHRTLEETPITP